MLDPILFLLREKNEKPRSIESRAVLINATFHTVGSKISTQVHSIDQNLTLQHYAGNIEIIFSSFFNLTCANVTSPP